MKREILREAIENALLDEAIVWMKGHHPGNAARLFKNAVVPDVIGGLHDFFRENPPLNGNPEDHIKFWLPRFKKGLGTSNIKFYCVAPKPEMTSAIKRNCHSFGDLIKFIADGVVDDLVVLYFVVPGKHEKDKKFTYASGIMQRTEGDEYGRKIYGCSMTGGLGLDDEFEKFSHAETDKRNAYLRKEREELRKQVDNLKKRAKDENDPGLIFRVGLTAQQRSDAYKPAKQLPYKQFNSPRNKDDMETLIKRNKMIELKI